MDRKKIKAKIISQESIAKGIFSMRLHAPSVAGEAGPGQFVMVYTKDPSRLLPRPISICSADGDELRLVYRVAGGGTDQFSKLFAGDEIYIMGPLGHGYDLDTGEGASLLIGGGIGIPPMLELAKRLGGEKTILLGYKDEIFLKEDFLPFGRVITAAEGTEADVQGTVMAAADMIPENVRVIYACGPRPMLRAIKEYAEKTGRKCFVSMEERMACGVGACLGCVCRTTQTDGHSHVNNARVCTEGPVFDAEKVEI